MVFRACRQLSHAKGNKGGVGSPEKVVRTLEIVVGMDQGAIRTVKNHP